jgi:DNA polymerase-3 subunit delta'
LSDPPEIIVPPRANALLAGQEDAEAVLLRAHASGRMPHAWLIAGPMGVGKATLAFRFARFLFAGSRPGGSLSVAESDPVFHRVASGGHADLLTVERQFDEERGRQRREIAVDDIRRVAPFLHLTAAEGGWRVVVIDGADGMNRSGQNAVLKILEEPPDNAVLLLLTERPMTLLPTIRSRCRQLVLPPLSVAAVDRLLAVYRPALSAARRTQLARIAQGSIGRALAVEAQGGLDLLTGFLAVAASDPVDWPAMHALGDRLGAASADQAYRTLVQLVVDWLAESVRNAAAGVALPPDGELVPGEQALALRLAGPGRLERALEVWEKVSRLFARSEGANLDRRLTMISALDAVSAALR